MNDEIAWMPLLAQQYLDFIVNSHPHTRVFEYGSGKSTLYFSGIGADIVSVEHDPEWYYKIKSQVKNVNLKLIVPDCDVLGNDVSEPKNYASNSVEGNFKRYVSEIDTYPCFDIVFIDGRARVSCLKHSVKKVKSGGWIVLDDADRDYYLANTLHLFAGWETVLFSGCPIAPWKTLFIRKPIE